MIVVSRTKNETAHKEPSPSPCLAAPYLTPPRLSQPCQDVPRLDLVKSTNLGVVR